MICDHKNDVLQEETTIKNNSFLDLIFAKNELEEFQKESNPEFSRKNVEGKFICKNVILKKFKNNQYFCKVVFRSQRNHKNKFERDHHEF